jgi:nicotinate-nucleotide--dimethylbenzimidazole phosphoribosyltransferase
VAKSVILIDGFIVSAALLAAHALDPRVLDYSICAHRSNEQSHARLLDHLGQTPLLDLGLRLGEGTGAILAFPLLESAVRVLNEMATFKSAKVSSASR